MKLRYASIRTFCVLSIVLSSFVATAQPGLAQSQPPQRVLRTYVPQDQIVSFLPSTTFDRFIDLINPIFERVTGKEVVYPETRGGQIGIPVSGMHYMDAFELVLAHNKLTYRETDRYFWVEEAATAAPAIAVQAAAQAGTAAQATVSVGTREVLIKAVLFEVNRSKVRELGIDWGMLFGSSTSGGTTRQASESFGVRTDGLSRALGGVITTPEAVALSTITQALRFLESEGAGETVARPQITVRSGEQGRIQIGSDVPIQTRDFAGNTITQFFSTGIIVDVTPTLISEAADASAGAPILDFIDLDVQIEKSGSRPSAAGPVIDRNTANTRVLLLDGEQTVIGGLFSNESVKTRQGVPVLKDLPGWFFGLRYVFGRDMDTTAQKELLILLEAEVLDPLTERASAMRGASGAQQ